MKQPIQPLYTDENGSLRFRQNNIVRYLLDFGGIDLNRLSIRNFSNEDWVQFAQLIGYSLNGFGELSYVSNEDYNVARKIHEDSKSETQARD